VWYYSYCDHTLRKVFVNRTFRTTSSEPSVVMFRGTNNHGAENRHGRDVGNGSDPRSLYKFGVIQHHDYD